jgi:hypothetical protein
MAWTEVLKACFEGYVTKDEVLRVRGRSDEAALPRHRRPARAEGAMSLLTDLDGFYTEHRRCGELEAGVEGPSVWFDCECGARIARRADDGDVLDLNG